MHPDFIKNISIFTHHEKLRQTSSKCNDWVCNSFFQSKSIL